MPKESARQRACSRRSTIATLPQISAALPQFFHDPSSCRALQVSGWIATNQLPQSEGDDSRSQRACSPTGGIASAQNPSAQNPSKRSKSMFSSMYHCNLADPTTIGANDVGKEHVLQHVPLQQGPLPAWAMPSHSLHNLALPYIQPARRSIAFPSSQSDGSFRAA